MKTFVLKRIEDVSGVSGTGIVAEGIVFSNGKVVLSWITALQSVSIYDDIETCELIHGHDGKTFIVYMENRDSCISCLARLYVDASLNHPPTPS